MFSDARNERVCPELGKFADLGVLESLLFLTALI